MKNKLLEFLDSESHVVSIDSEFFRYIDNISQGEEIFMLKIKNFTFMVTYSSEGDFGEHEACFNFTNIGTIPLFKV